MSGLDMNFSEDLGFKIAIRTELNKLCELIGDCPSFDLLQEEYSSDNGFQLPYNLRLLEEYVDELFDRFGDKDLDCYSLIMILIMVHFNTRVNLVYLDLCEPRGTVPISRTHHKASSLYNMVRDVFVAKKVGNVVVYRECLRIFDEYAMKYFAGNEVFLYFRLDDDWGVRVIIPADE